MNSVTSSDLLTPVLLVNLLVACSSSLEGFIVRMVNPDSSKLQQCFIAKQKGKAYLSCFFFFLCFFIVDNKTQFARGKFSL